MSEESVAAVECSKCSAVMLKLGKTNCYGPEPESAPPRPGRCPTANHAATIERAFDELAGDGEDGRMARTAARVEGLGYERSGGNARARWTRLEDTIAFARLMGYRKIGIATCVGLLEESERLAAILEAQGLEPLSVCCKSGSIDKTEMGVAEDEKIRPGKFEAACNPIAQAEICNRLGTDLNVIMGLCVGHDALFNKHSRAPVTTLVVKDRVTGHNPAAVLYGQNYYRFMRRRLDLPGVDPAR